MTSSHYFPVQATIISSSPFAHQQPILSTAALSLLLSTPSSDFTSHPELNPSPFRNPILSPSAFPLTHSMSVSLLSLKKAKGKPALDYLYFFFPLLRMLFPKISVELTPSLRFLLKCHLPSKAFPNHPAKK